MIALLLCLLFLDPPRLAILDRQFAESQEHFVIDTLSPQDPLRGIGAMFGPDVERYIGSLGCDHAGCRETAAEQLAAMGDRAFAPLVWATRHRSEVIAGEARHLLRRLFYRCFRCGGGGVSIDGYFDQCFLCHGLGNVRWRDFLDDPW